MVTNKWMTGHDLFIKLYSKSLIEGSDPPVSMLDGFETVKILEEIYNIIKKEEREYDVG